MEFLQARFALPALIFTVSNLAAIGHWVCHAQLDYVAMKVDAIQAKRGPSQQTGEL